MAKQATIIDVAKQAGVSTATVSYILNNTPGHSFTEETISRVNDAVQQLGYVRRSNARKPKTAARRGGCICVAYANESMRTPGIVPVILEALQQQGFQVRQISTASHAGHQIEETLEQCLADDVDGIICIGIGGKTLSPEWSNRVVEQRIPFVSVDCFYDRNISSVEIDYLMGAYQLAAELIRNGATKIFYLHDNETMPQTVERMRGIRRAVFESNRTSELILAPDLLKHDPFITLFSNEDYDDSLTRIRTALDGLDRNSAVLLDWADHNQYVLRLCIDAGLDIPIAALERGTLSVKAFPNLRYSLLPLKKMGTTAVDLMLQLLKDPANTTHAMLLPELHP